MFHLVQFSGIRSKTSGSLKIIFNIKTQKVHAGRQKMTGMAIEGEKAEQGLFF